MTLVRSDYPIPVVVRATHFAQTPNQERAFFGFGELDRLSHEVLSDIASFGRGEIADHRPCRAAPDH
jgi:hypothetical protein